MKKLSALLTAAVLALALPGPVHADQPGVTAECDATGATDATDCLNGFLASLTSGSIAQLAQYGTYRVEGTLLLSHKQQISLQGHGATIYATTRGNRSRAHLVLDQDDDVSVQDLTIKGANAHPGSYVSALEGQHGVRVVGSSRIALTDLTITHVWGDFVWVGKDVVTHGVFVGSHDVNITDNTFDGSGRQGISVVGNSDRVLIDHNDIRAAQRSIIDLEPETRFEHANDVTISNNTVTPGHHEFVAAAVGGQTNNVLVENNTGVGKALVVWIRDKNNAGKSNWTVRNDVSDTTYGSNIKGVVRASNVKGVRVFDNVQPIQHGRHMVALYADHGTCGATAHGNTLLEGRTGAEKPQSGGETLSPLSPCPGGTSAGNNPALPDAPRT